MKRNTSEAIRRAMMLHVPSLPTKAHPDFAKLDEMLLSETLDDKQLLELRLLAIRFALTEEELQTRASALRRGIK